MSPVILLSRNTKTSLHLNLKIVDKKEGFIELYFHGVGDKVVKCRPPHRGRGFVEKRCVLGRRRFFGAKMPHTLCSFHSEY